MYACLVDVVLFYEWAMNCLQIEEQREDVTEPRLQEICGEFRLCSRPSALSVNATAPRVGCVSGPTYCFYESDICFVPLLVVCSLAFYIVYFPIYLFHCRHVNYIKYLRSALICTQLDSNPTSTLDTPLASFISFGLYTARVDAFLNHPVPPQIDLLPQWYWRTWQLPQTRWGGRSFFPPKSLAFRTISCCPLLPRLLWACLKTACIRRCRGWLNRKGSRVKVYLKMVHWERGARKLRGTQTAFIQ